MLSKLFRRKSQSILLIILTASAVFHFAYIWELRQTPYISYPLVDADIYNQKAINILEEGWLGDRIFYQAPLYPYILAIIYKLFGTNIEMVICIQATCSVLSVYLIYLMGKKLFSIEVGILSAVLTLFYGVFVFYSGFLLKSSFSILFTCLFLISILKAEESKTFISFLRSGTFLGICITLRGNFLLIFVGFLPWIYMISKKYKLQTQNLLGFILGMTLIIFPITFRNYYLENDFILINSDAGSNYFIGNNPKATGYYETFGFIRAHPKYERRDMTTKAEKIMGRSLKPSEVSQFWFQIAFSFIQEKPIQWLELQLEKFLIFINNYEKSDNYHFGFTKKLIPVLNVGFIPFGGILILSLTAIAIGRWRKPKFFVFYIHIFVYTLSVVIFYVNSRYRLPLVPALIPFAAWMLIEGISRVFLSPGRKQIGIGCLALISALGTFRDIGHLDIAIAHLNYGNILRLEGQLGKARTQYQIALKLDPDQSIVYFNLAGLEQQKGHWNNAIQYYKQALDYLPLQGQIHNNLGVILMNQNKWKGAEKEFLKAIKLQSDQVEPYKNLATVYIRQDRKEMANRFLQQAHRLEALNKKP